MVDTKLGIISPLSYGAQPDGQTLCTTAIQNCIDACHSNGGGTVWLSSGTFVSGTIVLKDNVRLHLEPGATLRATEDLEAFPSVASRYAARTGEYVTHKAVVRAEDARNIAITGHGTIDGSGDAWAEGPYGTPSAAYRPRIVYFRACSSVHIRDISLTNAASWVQTYQSCRNVCIDGITVDSRENPDIEEERYARVRGRNTDGLDIVDCQSVTIANCRINSGDDGICLKSLSPDESCSDILVTNCAVSTNASGIKIGTESSGAFADILVSNCSVYDTRNDAISLTTVDGARLERVTVSSISLRNIKGAAIFIRLGARNRTYGAGSRVNDAVLRDVVIHSVQGTRLSAEFPCSVTGLPGRPVENIHLQAINLECEGGIKEMPGDAVPENETEYPNSKQFGTLPAYGFYLRHGRNISLNQVRVRTIQPDIRPPLVAEDITELDLSGSKQLGQS